MNRFTQDALENPFFTVRFKNPVPTALEFKNALRIITVSQCITGKSTSSYEADDSTQCHSILDISLPSTSTSEDGSLLSIEPNDFNLNLSPSESSSLDHLGGYAVHQFAKLNIHCDNCMKTLIIDPPAPLEHTYTQTQSLVQLRDYTKKALIYISPEVKKLLETAENIFVANEKEILTKQNVLVTLVNTCLSTAENTIPDCHHAASKILKTYFRIRIFALLEKKKKENKKTSSGKGSKSITMRELVNK